MYLHECYVVPKAALVAVVEYLRKRPFEDVAGLLQGLDGSPEGTSAELAKAGVDIAKADANGMYQIVVSELSRNELDLLAVDYNFPSHKHPASVVEALEAKNLLEISTYSGTGETVADFPAGVGRRE